MRAHLRRFADALRAVLRVLSGLLVMASVAVNFANIIGRYFFSVSIYWAEEVMLYLMVGAVFLAIGLVGWEGRHIRMDVIVSLLPAKLRDGLALLCELVLIAASLALAVFAWPVLTMLAEFDQRSTAGNIPLVIPQSMVPLGLVIMAVLVALRLITRGANGHNGDKRGAGPAH